MPIRILDAATVGRIAAGEVVERPSSVVKELMENALDAGATSITVEIKGGGIEMLRVSDNGCGIEPGQVRLAFENHATSKLQSADQLDDLKTLGFRGEALPSIAAVSRVTMRTRVKNAESGTQITIEGGENISVTEAACPDGTTIIMRDLFFNIPVRRAFLKKPAYEAGLVSDAVAHLLIGNPDVSVRFINNGKTVFRSYGDGNLRHAMFAVYGKEIAEGLIELDAAEGGTRVRGLIGVGAQAKATRAHQLFFINGRSVRCPMLSRALEQGCTTRVMIGTYPMCALSLTIPPHSVDVNVHPNKLEVRFRDEYTMQETVQSLLQRAFEGERALDVAAQIAPRQQVSPERVVREIVPPPAAPDEAPPTLEALLQSESQRVAAQGAQTDAPRMRETFFNPIKPFVPPEKSAEPTVPTARPEAKPLPAAPRERPEMPPLPFAQVEPPAPVEPLQTPYRVIGVAFHTYLILEAGDSLLLIDQHAAHERIRYEEYLRHLDEGTCSQQLLIPQVIRLSSREMALIQDHLDVLEEAGYTIEVFGASDIRVRAVPFLLGEAQLRPVFMDVINNLTQVKQATHEEKRARIMQMACKSAVKGGDALTDSDIRCLLKALEETAASATCPHGRPIVQKIDKREIEKMFRRVL